MTNITNFLKEVKVELGKVNWPTKQQTVLYTLVVIGMSVVTALFLGMIDLGFQKILNKFLIK